MTPQTILMLSLAAVAARLEGGHRAVAEAVDTGAVLEARAQKVRANAQLLTIAQRRAYNGSLLNGPHAAFVRGEGLLWLQHVPKTGGTTLCSVIRENVPASTHGCLLEPPALVRQKRLWTHKHISARVFPSMAEVEGNASALRVRAVSNEQGAVPQMVASANRSRWVFVTAMRHPLDRLLSQLQYTMREIRKADKALLLAHALNATTGGWQSQGCAVDNYATRIFADRCAGADGRSALSETDYARAEAMLRRFDICFVTEWMLEMAPLLRYTLGFADIDARPHNVANNNAAIFSKSDPGGDTPPRVSAARLLSPRSLSADASRLFGATSAEYKKLAALHAFDLRLYEACKAHARALVRAYLFVDPL